MYDSRERYFHPTAEIHADTKIGNGTQIWNLVQLRVGCEIGENCNLGKGVYIDCGVKIGNNVKIQNGVSVYQGITIEDDVFVGPHVVFSNDKYPRSFNKEWKIVPTLIKKGASLGAGSIILCGLTIGKYSMIGLGCVVIKDAPNYGLVVGNPGKLVAFVCECAKRLETQEIQKEYVLMKCCDCDRIITISRDDYLLLKE